jgi:hypothetical protein
LKISLYFRTGFFCLLLLCALGASGHERQINKGFVQKMEDGSIALEFLLDPAVLMFQALTPETTLPLFLKRYAEMKPEVFESEMKKLKAHLVKGIKLQGPDGRALQQNAWKWPPGSDWQDIIKTQKIMLDAISNEEGHLPQIKLNIVLKGGKNLSRAQVSLHPSMHPILVRNMPVDDFWLTDQIPVAIISF